MTKTNILTYTTKAKMASQS